MEARTELWNFPQVPRVGKWRKEHQCNTGSEKSSEKAIQKATVTWSHVTPAVDMFSRFEGMGHVRPPLDTANPAHVGINESNGSGRGTELKWG